MKKNQESKNTRLRQCRMVSREGVDILSSCFTPSYTQIGFTPYSQPLSFAREGFIFKMDKEALDKIHEERMKKKKTPVYAYDEMDYLVEVNEEVRSNDN